MPNFGTNLGTQNTQRPLVLLLSMKIGVVKIVEQCSDFLYSPWFKTYAKKSEGPRLLEGELKMVPNIISVYEKVQEISPT